MAPAQKFHDHLKELRRRILWVVLSIGLSAGVSYALRVRIVSLLQHPLGAPLFYSSPAGSFNFILELSMLIGLFITLPVIVYHLLRFIEPALPVRIKRKTMLLIICSSFVLAVIGICFSFFYLLPLSLKFFSSYSSAQIKPLISADEYLSFVTGHLTTFALMFQIPLIVLFINWIKPIKPGKLLKYQRHVVVGAFGLAIILPFTYDPISQFIVAIPIVVLFYVSALLLWFANRKQRPKMAQPQLDIKPSSSVPQTVAIRPQPMATRDIPSPTNLRPRPMFTTDGFAQPARAVNISSARHFSRQVIESRRQSRTNYPQLGRRSLSIDGVSTFSPPASI